MFVEESYPVFANGYVSLVKNLLPGAVDILATGAVASGKIPASEAGALRKKTMRDSLDVVATGDADNPLRLGLGIPIFPLDIWEHAYFLGKSSSALGSHLLMDGT